MPKGWGPDSPSTLRWWQKASLHSNTQVKACARLAPRVPALQLNLPPFTNGRGVNSNWSKYTNYGEMHNPPNFSKWLVLWCRIVLVFKHMRRHMSLRAHTSAHMNAHTSLGAQMSAHVSLGTHTSAHKSFYAHTSAHTILEHILAHIWALVSAFICPGLLPGNNWINTRVSV